MAEILLRLALNTNQSISEVNVLDDLIYQFQAVINIQIYDKRLKTYPRKAGKPL